MANKDFPRGLLNPTPLTEQVATRTYTASGAVYRGDPCNLGADNTVVAAGAGPVTAFDVVAMHAAANGAPVVCCINPGSVSFEAQFDDNTVTTNVCGKTFDLVQAAADTLRGVSTCEVDGDTGDVANGCVRVVDMVDRPDNDITLANNVVRVTKVQTSLDDLM